MKSNGLIRALALLIALTIVFGLSAMTGAFAGESEDVPVISILNCMGASYADNLGILFLEEKFGVKFDMIDVPGEVAKEKFSIMVQSETLPDMIPEILRYASPTELYRLGQEGVIMTLNSLVENAPNILAQWEKYPDVRRAATAPDGNIYSLPAQFNDIGQDFKNRLFIDRTFLANLNMEMPTTTEEMYQFLKAVKENDANGNGDPNDEIPLISAEAENTSGSGGAWNMTDSLLMTAFTRTSTEDNRIIENGQVVFTPSIDGYREGLRYLHKLYAEGLIYSEVFSTGVDQIWALNESDPDVNTLAVIVGHHRNAVCNWGSERWRSYDYVGPLTGPDGKGYVSQTPGGGIQQKVAFSADNKYPELSMAINDYLVTEEGGWLVRRGLKGNDYVDADPGLLDIMGEPAVFRFTTTEERGDNFVGASLNIIWPCVLLPEYGSTPVVPGNEPGDYWDYYHGEYFARMYRPFALPADNFWPVTMYYSAESLNRLSLLQTDLDNHVGLTDAQFIMGARDIETEWGDYLNELNSMGLEEYLQLSQKEYDANMK